MSRRRVLLGLLTALVAGCGGSGGGSPFASLSGRLTVLSGIPLLASSPHDREPNDSIASARLGEGEVRGFLEGEGIDAFRRLASATGAWRARVESASLDAEAILHSLESGRSGPCLHLAQGEVFDVVVMARDGAGSYRVLLESVDAPEEIASLPEAYRECGEGHRHGELIAAPVEGSSAEALAEAAGLVCVAGDARLCLLRAPGPPEKRPEFDALCSLLVRCAHLEAARLVRYAEPNYLRELAAPPDDPLFGEQWALAQVRAEGAWAHTTGDPAIVIGFVDSGIRAGHPDLAGRVVPGWDFVQRDADPDDPAVISSHGTHVAGILAAATNNGEGVAGMQWNGRVMAGRAFDTAGFGTVFDISEAIRFCAGLANVSGILPDTPAQVINMSFASATPTVTEESACDAARDAGVFLCAAAGNHSSGSIRYPGGYASVCCVAATSRSGAAAGYSNFGTWIDIAGPGGLRGDGVRVLQANGAGTFSYTTADGTSFACPHVAATAGLVLSRIPRTPAQMHELLTMTAQDVGTPGVDTRTGSGIVDAHAAMLMALGLPAPVLVPGEKVIVQLRQTGSGAVVSSTQTSEAGALQWNFGSVTGGSYLIVAGTDRDFDGQIDDPGEVCGTLAAPISVAAGQSLANLDIVIARK